MNESKTEIDRLKAANEFIKVIASCGRKFFSENADNFNKVDAPFVASMEVDKHGKVWFIDSYTKKRIYTHYRYDWKGFSNGGTLKSLVCNLRDFIKRGDTLRKEYFQPEMGEGFRNPWGYGEDILKVKDAAVSLGIAV